MSAVSVSLSPDPLADLRELLRYPFMLHALTAGTAVAVLAAITGWYMVLRRQAFAGHSLSVMAFPGAAGAALAGLPATLGYYVVCGAAALAIGGAGRPAGRRPMSAASVGTVQAVGLAAGFLFLSLNASLLTGPETLLFGSFLGVTSGQVTLAVLVAGACLAALAVIGRPLLFATLDPEGARAAGVPLRALDVTFMLVLAAAVATTSQITGALLVFALLLAPPAAAQMLTARPALSLLAGVLISVALAWLSLALAYFTPYPVGFYLAVLGLGAYLPARLAGRARARP